MTIEITYQRLLPEDVRLTVDGVCQHKRVDFEELEDHNGHQSMEMVCIDCPAVYNDLNEKWEA